MAAPLVPILLAGLVGYAAFGELQKRGLLGAPAPAPTPAPAPVPIAAPRPYVAPSPLPPEAPRPAPPPIMNAPNLPRMQPTAPPPRAPAPAPVVVAQTPAGNPVIVIGPVDSNTGKVTVAAHAATSGPAAPAARALYDYLLANGNAATGALSDLTSEFQRQSNADPESIRVNGRLTESGAYDTPTSGALAVYTGQPILPTPNTPPTYDTTFPGNANAAAFTASSLYAYLKTHPRKSTSPTANANADPTLKEFTRAFQKAVNTDPSYPGPALPYPSARIIKVALTEDGIYGPKTSDALAVSTFERIPV